MMLSLFISAPRTGGGSRPGKARPVRGLRRDPARSAAPTGDEEAYGCTEEHERGHGELLFLAPRAQPRHDHGSERHQDVDLEQRLQPRLVDPKVAAAPR